MKKILLAVSVSLLLFMVSACAKVEPDVTQKPSDKDPSETSSPAATPTPKPQITPTSPPTSETTVLPTPSPTPFPYVGLDVFLKDPLQFMWQNTLPLPGMKTAAANNELFTADQPSPKWLIYESCDWDNPDKSKYELVVPVDDQRWTLEKIGEVFGGALGIQYEKRSNTVQLFYDYAYSPGSAGSYSESYIHLGMPMVGDGYMALSFLYAGLNERYAALAKECFALDKVELPELLRQDAFSHRLSNEFAMPSVSGPSVSQTWTGLNGQEGAAVKQWITQRKFVINMEYSDMRTDYWLALDDEILQGIFADVFNMGSKAAPDYMITLTIILKADAN